MIHSDQQFPGMALVKQTLFRSQIIDIRNAVETTLKKLNPERPFRQGETVAVAVGSRGINHIETIVQETIQFLIQIGLKPFIVPAMGSHGGGTPEGQEKILRKFGISKSEMSVPVISNMEAANIG
ncbi:MAG: DUF362 domain-containing protein, partial [Deltaproteobacteria bacterium]|nr:DUF362 domain-containing protein [Deltaproteobacteria bacterium]